MIEKFVITENNKLAAQVYFFFLFFYCCSTIGFMFTGAGMNNTLGIP